MVADLAGRSLRSVRMTVEVEYGMVDGTVRREVETFELDTDRDVVLFDHEDAVEWILSGNTIKRAPPADGQTRRVECGGYVKHGKNTH